MINDFDRNFINAINTLVGCDLFKIVNKDAQYLFYRAKMGYKDKIPYTALVTTQELKKCRSREDFFLLALRELNTY